MLIVKYFNSRGFRASYFTAAEQQLLMEFYEEVKDTIRKKVNTNAIIKEREKAWQTIADRLNATNLTGHKRTWQQVKIKYKNILQAAHRTGTGGGPPSQDMTPAEELALHLNKGRPVIEGIQGGPVTDSGECTYAAAECTSADEETVSLDSRRLEDPDAAQSPKQPGNITSQTVRTLYAKHLERQIELADVKITLKKRKLQEMELDLEIKRRTLRKLDLEIQKLQREDPSNPDK
ncbi:hypothetical protein IRJ41_013654 [Triplophysa rosa]|uniref:Myb/SANT-like DNA-binding domain-containing protein n=1 Tax=Triplophysa rosa TaxID=992332 RepID=A0A9W7WCK2_TRIRA|nr:hypothetical protein IRJ41_013654 [Triplophysa rosa]